MQLIVQAVPLLLFGTIVALIVARALAGRSVRIRPGRARRPKPARRPKNMTLRVTHTQMDDELKDLIRKS